MKEAHVFKQKTKKKKMSFRNAYLMCVENILFKRFREPNGTGYMRSIYGNANCHERFGSFSSPDK